MYSYQRNCSGCTCGCSGSRTGSGNCGCGCSGSRTGDGNCGCGCSSSSGCSRCSNCTACSGGSSGEYSYCYCSRYVDVPMCIYYGEGYSQSDSLQSIEQSLSDIAQGTCCGC